MKLVENGKHSYIDYTEEIERGAALLDEVAPGWYNQIDTRFLTLSSASSCVLGQLALTQIFKDVEINEALRAPGYDADYSRLSALLSEKAGITGHEAVNEYMADHGFLYWDDRLTEAFPEDFSFGSIGYGMGLVGVSERGRLVRERFAFGYDQLTTQWKAYIANRRKEELQVEQEITDITAETLLANLPIDQPALV